MLRHATTWFACLAVALTTVTVDNNAEAFHHHRRGYAYGGYYGGGYGGGYGGACCGTTAAYAPSYSYGAVSYQQPITYQQPMAYQQPAYQQPMAYQQTGWSGDACSVQPAGHQTMGYAPQGGYGVQGTYQSGQAPPPPPAESDNAPPRTFNQAPQPAPPQPRDDNNE
jgi:hypothetical protein